jgi:hypothetical protein
MTIEIRDGSTPARDVSLGLPAAERIDRIWAHCMVGLGLLATVGWMALLGWLLVRAVLILA